MLVYYGLAQLAFVGGSLVNTGCQNVLEPAALGLPVLVGPSQFNFQTICEQLAEVGALRTVADENVLASDVVRLLQDDSARHAMGDHGRAAVAANKGALDRIYDLTVQYLGA